MLINEGPKDAPAPTRLSRAERRELAWASIDRALELACYQTFRSARTRAKALGRSYTLTPDDEGRLITASAGRCMVTGVRFDLARHGFRVPPFRPTLDRIHSKGGYDIGNVRLVAYATNVALLHWGEALFAKLAIGYVQSMSTVVDDSAAAS